MQQYILIVDDEDISLFLNRKIVEHSGTKCEIVSANSGFKALEIINQKRHDGMLPKFIFLDLNMPLMNGFEFLDKFKALNFLDDKGQVIVVSSSTDGRDRARAKALGAFDFVSKPLSVEFVKDLL